MRRVRPIAGIINNAESAAVVLTVEGVEDSCGASWREDEEVV